jgi:phosphatidylglycerophosphate synthase
MTHSFKLIGESRHRIFSQAPEELLQRQLLKQVKGATGSLIVRADIAVTDAVLSFLCSASNTVIVNKKGELLAAIADPLRVAELEAAAAVNKIPPGFVVMRNGQLELYVRRIRRQTRVEVFDLREIGHVEAEERMFSEVYKGVTDIVTAKLWPAPALAVVRVLAGWNISPNIVTLTGLVLMFAASYWFYTAQWLPGLLAAWVMTFLDTVDGKLARVTAQSSVIGNLLDHVTDYVHPPIWWISVALGIASTTGSEGPYDLWTMAIVALVSYVLGRFAELWFRKYFGFNQYMWKPLDSAFRSIIARRNVNLVILTIGWLIGMMYGSYVVFCAWGILSTVIQIIRCLQAYAQSKQGGAITNWMEQEVARS